MTGYLARVTGLLLVLLLQVAIPTARAGGDAPVQNVTPKKERNGVDLHATEQEQSGSNQGQGGGAGDKAAAERAAAEARRVAECEERNRQAEEQSRLDGILRPKTICDITIAPRPPGAGVDPAVAARAAVLRLPIPQPYARVGPPPSVNEWNMVAVGYPLWLWVEGEDRYAATVTEQGITLNLTARRKTTQFDLGDPQAGRVFCGLTPAWHPGVKPAQPSPGCGYVYQHPSLPEGTYRVTATTHWEVTWSALGRTGTLPFERTGPATELPVGELHALRVR